MVPVPVCASIKIKSRLVPCYYKKAAVNLANYLERLHMVREQWRESTHPSQMERGEEEGPKEAIQIYR